MVEPNDVQCGGGVQHPHECPPDTSCFVPQPSRPGEFGRCKTIVACEKTADCGNPFQVCADDTCQPNWALNVTSYAPCVFAPLGATGGTCANSSATCVASPYSTCDPTQTADCPGLCVPPPSCAGVACKHGKRCKLCKDASGGRAPKCVEQGATCPVVASKPSPKPTPALAPCDALPCANGESCAVCLGVDGQLTATCLAPGLACPLA